MNGAAASDALDVRRRPARLVVATIVLGLTGVAFLAAAVILIYGTQVNSPSVAQMFATVAVVLLAIAVVQFVIVRGIWSGARRAALLGMVIALIGVAISAYVWFDQFTHSQEALQISSPFLVTALLYAVCLISLLTSGQAFTKS